MLRLKASVDYGLRIVLCLAVADKSVSSLELAERMAIPRDYVVQLATKLRHHGIIKSIPGRNGGYKLARPTSEITALQIVETFDDHQHAKHDIKKKRDPDALENQVRYMHEGVVGSFCSFLNAITVEDLLAVRTSPEDIDLIAAKALEDESKRMYEKATKKAERKAAKQK